MNNAFTFLNRLHVFKNCIDWNYGKYGKLWTYNLNYFDFLNQKKITKELGLKLIEDYIIQDKNLKDGKEPYPISLRSINWIKFVSRHKISNVNIDKILYNDFQILLKNIEYHLMGNHLLENGFALFFGGYYFRDEKLYKLAKKILKKELNEQILQDGAHFELSPMYHQILLNRLLDCINLIRNNLWVQDELLHVLNEKGGKMLSWLQTVTYKCGTIPMVNDSAYGIAPNSKDIFRYARELEIKWDKINLFDSGYRKKDNDFYELFFDVGNIGPKYQPGHAHSDTFNFELYVQGKPVIVDLGTSTYEKNEKRQLERSTHSHNTVQVGSLEQSEIWGGFRVGRRAEIIELKEQGNSVVATHNGYKRLNVFHTREFKTFPEEIQIIDSLSGTISLPNRAYFHLYPDVKNLLVNGNMVKLDENIAIEFIGSEKIKVENYEYALGFNKTKKAKRIVVNFKKELTTKINL
ncbi:alginate lyase family protein [Tamlana sp. 2201CG12-4]|uniref:alginate lyase family protein n=1 Tax=Tamlana sp. 2201CG12-4 TaxID=3112582 RepID=UPI002DBEC38B|nr:alginate lyase family protein [Tamlana sp. 2201CG12-4]MEC3906310.1 alginate lyase family protein [Tamlana sp. 2201CG12-4]